MSLGSIPASAEATPRSSVDPMCPFVRKNTKIVEVGMNPDLRLKDANFDFSNDIEPPHAQ